MRNCYKLFILLLSFHSNCAEVCLCDSTSVCDILCCCDQDCSTDEKESFTCDLNLSKTLQPSRACVSRNIFSKISMNKGFSIVEQNDDYCFSSSTSSSVVSSTKTTSMKSSSIDTQNLKAPLTYSKTFSGLAASSEGLRVGDPVYLKSTDTGIHSPLLLPAGLRDLCVRDSVLHLRNTTSSCSLKLTSSLCSTGSKLDFSNYQDLKFLSNFRNSSVTSSATEDGDDGSSEQESDEESVDDEGQANVVSELTKEFESIEVKSTCYDKEGVILTCASPTVDSSTCVNVLYKIELIFIHTDSLTSAEFKLFLGSVNIDDTIRLATAVSFYSKSNEYHNSGPRYQRYKKDFDVYFNLTENKSFFIPFEDDTGCKTNHRIKFPASVITSCTKTVDVDSTDISALVGNLYGNLPKALAKFYNSDLKNADEWLDLDWELPVVLNATNVPTFVELTIRHKSFGSQNYPKNEIISATATVSTSNLQDLKELNLFNDKVVFYFSVRFFSVDVNSRKDEHIFDRLSRTFPDYSFPFQMLFVAVAVFVIFTVAILVREQGKPEF